MPSMQFLRVLRSPVVLQNGSTSLSKAPMQPNGKSRLSRLNPFAVEPGLRPAHDASTTSSRRASQHTSQQQQDSQLQQHKKKFESLDYEVVENTVYRADQASQTHLDHISTSAAKWTMCFLLGVCLPTASWPMARLVCDTMIPPAPFSNCRTDGGAVLCCICLYVRSAKCYAATSLQ